jgi:hypothetical protein
MWIQGVSACERWTRLYSVPNADFNEYWNWGRYALDPIHSPLFDGSATSMSSNGLYYKL